MPQEELSVCPQITNIGVSSISIPLSHKLHWEAILSLPFEKAA
jgi:hypothetical protein